MKRFVTRALIVVAAILGMMFAQVAPASADPPDELTRDLATLWTDVLQTKASKNPAVNEDAGPACWNLGHRTVAQFGFVPNQPCTVKPGTNIFVAAYSGECSTFDNDCNRETGPDPCTATTADGLLACTRKIDAAHSPDAGLTVTLNGDPLEPLTEVDVPGLNIQLPEDNIFDALIEPTPKGKGLSSAHGWVYLIDQADLHPGSNEIVINDPILGTVTTTIIVTKGH
ncbi:MAG: hypothetical protein ACJ72M_04660 [Propionibacteriaceae bacterium]|jgi:hypothetical protein